MQDRDARQSIDIVDGEVSRTIKQFVSLIGDDGKAQFTTHDATRGVFLHDSDGCIIDVDEQGCDSLDRCRDDLIGLMMGEIDVDFPKPFIKELWQSRTSNGPMMRYGRLRRKNAPPLSVQISVYAVAFGDECLFLSGTKSISDQERVEAALALSENQLRAVIDAEPECVKLVSRDGILMEMNPAGLAMVEADRPEDVIGKEIALLVHEEDRAAFVEVNRGAFEGRSGIAEFRITGMKGTQRWLETHVSPLKGNDGEVTAALSITREITERKRSDDLLLKLLEGTAGSIGSDFFRGLVKAMAETLEVAFAFVGEVKKDQDSDMMDLASVKTICSWADGSFGKDFEYRLIDTPCRSVFSGDMCHYEQGVETLFPKDLMLGEMSVDSYLGIPLKSESGSVVGILVAMDRKPMPHSDRTKAVFRIFASRASSELNRILTRRHEEELERQLQQVQRMESIGTLAGGIAHDFNNIVCAIMANADLAMLDLDSTHPASESVEGIVKSTKRASALISQIMMFSRHKTPVRLPVSLASTVTEARDMMRSLIPANVGLQCEIDPNQPNVLADADQVHQIIVNLCTNAWHAIGAKNGKIRISLSEVDVKDGDINRRVQLRNGSYVLLEVSDDGKGMDKEIQRRIFDPFCTTKDAGQGIGLGLSVVHGIVDLHDGMISVSSRAGIGSTFSIHLPVVEDLELLDGEVLSEAIEGNGRRVLCIDDEASIVDVTERLLERLGFVVTGMTDPEMGAAIFEKAPSEFDVVMVDYFMPKLTGLELIRKIRAIRKDLPIILSSGN
ncbi:MAG: PAS domain S-box protein, partial [Verrucomicrobia bacterium]|nr:PAS domain S-box protein [Verrucomicrobiota bacterium]